jgi:hypothetical protein
VNKAEARDAVVSAALTWYLGTCSSKEAVALMKACETLVRLHRPPGLLCGGCDDDLDFEHARDCPFNTLRPAP